MTTYKEGHITNNGQKTFIVKMKTLTRGYVYLGIVHFPQTMIGKKVVINVTTTTP